MNSYHTSDEARGLDALAVSRRCALLEDSENFPLVWMLQQRSMERGGLGLVASELLAMFPDRINWGHFRSIRWQPVDALASHLKACCLNPPTHLDSWDGKHWNGSLVDDLRAYRAHAVAQVEATFYRTQVAKSVFDGLDHALASPRSLTLSFGLPGVGKSEMARRWCEMHPGVARYIETPSVENDRAFYSAIAEELGVVRGPGYNSQQMSLRLIDVLKESRLMLVLDEAHRLFPHRNRPLSSPPRIGWLTMLTNAKVPVGLVGLPEFFKWKQLFTKWTNWDSSQFDRRFCMIHELPTRLCQDDLRGVARHLFPAGDKACHELLVSYAEASKINLSAITETLQTARIQAKRAGRTEATFADIQAVIRDVRAPMDCILAADPSQFDAAPDLSRSAKPRRQAPARRSRSVREPAAPAESAEDFTFAEREVAPPQVHRRAVASSPAAR